MPLVCGCLSHLLDQRPPLNDRNLRSLRSHLIHDLPWRPYDKRSTRQSSELQQLRQDLRKAVVSISSAIARRIAILPL